MPIVKRVPLIGVIAVLGLLCVATWSHAQVLTTGTIAGRVTDASGRGTPGVQITILDTGQTDVTNANGDFSISDVLPGTHTVEATLVGYQPARATNVVVTQELTTNIAIQLSKRAEISTGTQVVVAPLIHKNVTPTLYTVTSKEEQLVRSQPNNLYQYPGALISQPGIVPDQNGYPSVRGSRQNEVGYMLDGIMVTEPVTGQFATNLVTVGLDRMNIYTGGYRAELGSSIGGIINAVVKTGASIRGAAVEATTGSWDYSGLVYEQGNVEKGGFNWYVSGNFWRTRFEKNPAIEALPVSEDIIGKFIQPLGKKDRLAVLYTNGFEHYDYNLNDTFTGFPFGYNPLDPNGFPGVQSAHTQRWDFKRHILVDTPYTQDYEVQMHNIGSATWSHSFNSASSLSAQVYGWNHHVDFQALSPVEGVDERIANKQVNGRLEYASQLSPAFQFRLGGETMHSDNNLDVFADAGTFPTDAGTNAQIWQVQTNHPPTDDMNGYLSTTWKPTGRLTADIGVRYDSRTYHRKVTMADIEMGRTSTRTADEEVIAHTGFDPKYHAVTPRAGFTFTLGPRTLLKASGGRFAQFAPASYIERQYGGTPYDVPITFGGTVYLPPGLNWYQYRSRKAFDVKPEKVDSIDVGIEHQIGRNLGLAITPYWRKTTDMFERGNAYDYSGNPIGGGTAWSNRAHGHTHGVETKLEMRETRGLSGWITYTYQVAKATTTASFPGTSDVAVTGNNVEHRLDYDQKHTIYVVGKYNAGNFEFNPLLEMGSGYPWGGQPGDFIDPNTGNGNPYYSTSPNPKDNGAPLPILVNGKLQSLEPAPFNTGWHKNLSVTFRLYNDSKKSSYYFLQIQNILNSKDVTARYWFDPFTGSNLFGYVSGTTNYVDENGNPATAPGHFEYKPYTTVPPVFALIGIHQTF